MQLFFEILGTVAFAISGATTAIKKNMDIFGVIVLGVTTAVGGGIIRDLIIGTTPPTAFINPIYIIISVIVSLLVFIPKIYKLININNLLYICIDAIGLGVFTVIGVQKAMKLNNIFLEIFLGTVTGVGGGVLRDIFATELPIIFTKNFYAIASIIGAIFCILLYNADSDIAMLLSIIIIVYLRIAAAIFKWNLPKSN